MGDVYTRISEEEYDKKEKKDMHVEYVERKIHKL